MRKIARIVGMLLLCILLVQPVQAADKDITVKTRIRDDEIYLLIKDSQSSEAIAPDKNYRLIFMTEAEYAGEQVWLYTSEYDCTGEELEPYRNKNDKFDEPLEHTKNIAFQLWEENENGWSERSEICACKDEFSDGKEISVSEDSDGNEAESQDYILMDSEQKKIVLPLQKAAELYGIQVRSDMQGQVTEILDSRGTFIKDSVLFSASDDGLTLSRTVPLPTPQPTATPTPEPTATPQPTATPTPEPTATPQPTATPTPEPTATPQPTATPTPEPTATLEPTATPQPTATPTPEPTATPQPTATPTPEPTATPEATATPTPEPTVTPEPTATPAAATVTSEPAVTPTPEPSAPGSSSKKGSGGIVLFLMVVLLALIAVIIYLLQQSRKKKNRAEAQAISENPEDTWDPSDSEDTLHPDEELPVAPVQKSPFVIQSAVINNKGGVRRNNEDNFCLNGTIMQREKMDDGANISGISKEPVQLYAVCDGMGGTDNGEDASYAAVNILAERKEECGRWIEKSEFTKVLRSISDRIYKRSEQKGKKSGTTIVSMVWNREKAIFVNVGDSRIYRMRNHKLEQISLDHSKVQRMISMGVLDPEQAKTHPDRHVITQYLGMPSEVRISPYYVTDSSVKENDLYLMCSDGLTDMVEDAKIAEILNTESEPRKAAQALIKEALENGGRDNVTVMVLRIVKDPEGKKRI